MINGDKDSSLIKNIKSPSATQTAVLDRQARKNHLQNRDTKQYLGCRIRKYKIFNPILKTSADGTVVCTVTKLTAGENAKNKIFGKTFRKFDLWLEILKLQLKTQFLLKTFKNVPKVY